MASLTQHKTTLSIQTFFFLFTNSYSIHGSCCQRICTSAPRDKVCIVASHVDSSLIKTPHPFLKAISVPASLTSSNALDRLGFVTVIFPVLPCQSSIQFSSLLSCFICSLLCCLYLGGFEFDRRTEKGGVILKNYQRLPRSFYSTSLKGRAFPRSTHGETAEVLFQLTQAVNLLTESQADSKSKCHHCSMQRDKKQIYPRELVTLPH